MTSTSTQSPETETETEAIQQPTVSDKSQWKPGIFDCSKSADEREVTRLFRHSIVDDTIELQLRDLVALRRPEKKLEPLEIDTLVQEELGGLSYHQYGRWIHYSWDRRLVHLLPADEFREVRADRNRALITTDQRRRLQSCRIGIVGLSAGLACASTLVMEGVGGHYRLSDFDTMELSNLNRVPAGVQSIGLNKSVVAARALVELDPYVGIEIFERGVDSDNLDQFLGHGQAQLDLLVEECDDLSMKVGLREHARQRAIPVVMEMSFRGTVSVERFDLEPERPILHGLLGNVAASALKGLPTEEKVPYVMALLGLNGLSPELSASFIEIGQTLSTWPQLASWVSAGGALITGAARRVLLDTERRSGFFHLDGSSLPLPEQVPTTVEVHPEARAPRQHRNFPQRSHATCFSAPEVDFLVHYATMAPSGGNMQPWHFVAQEGRIDCFAHEARSTTFLNFRHVGTYVAIGAAVENLELAARALGLAILVVPFPDTNAPLLICSVTLEGRVEPKRSTLFEVIPQRVTNRQIAPPTNISSQDEERLRLAVGEAQLTLVQDRPTLDRIAGVLGEVDRLRLLSDVMHPELMSELRWTPEEVEQTRDGIDLATLEASPSNVVAIRMLGRETARFLQNMDGGRNLMDSAKKVMAGSSAFGLVSFPGSEPKSYFRGGRALQRLWLTATERGIAFQPMSVQCYLFPRLLANQGLTTQESHGLRSVHEAWNQLVPHPDDHVEIMAFRLSHARPASAISLRYALDQVLNKR